MHKEGNANRCQYLSVYTLINFRYVGKSTKITLKGNGQYVCDLIHAGECNFGKNASWRRPIMGRGYGNRQHLRLSELWCH
jgi:hypothetical protein